MKHKWLIIIVVVTILAIVSFFIVKKAKQKKETDSTGTSSSGSGSGTTTSKFPLKRGSTGDDVKLLQQRLNTIAPMLIPLSIDGIFGPKTESALYDVVRLKQLTQNQYNEFIQLTANVGQLGTYSIQIFRNKVQSA